LHDDIRKFNLAQTVQIDAPGSIQKGDDDNVSEVTADDNDDGTLERMDSTEGGIMGGEENGDAQFDFLDISNIHNNETPTTTLATSTGTFLPQPILLDDDHDDENAPGGSSSLKKKHFQDSFGMTRRPSSESSATFYLQSITSNENITHMSSHPDYDYYSISSSEDGGKEGAQRGPGPGRHPHRQQKDGEAEVGGAAAPVVTPSMQQQASTPLQTTMATPEATLAALRSNTLPKTKPANEKSEKLHREVAQVLGLPKDNILKKSAHGGRIMSRNTELQLRDIVTRASHRAVEVDGAEGDNIGSSTTKPTKTNTAKEEDDSSSSCSSSSSDLEFGTKQEKQEDVDKWERIRVQRQSSRDEIRRIRSEGSSTAAANENIPLLLLLLLLMLLLMRTYGTIQILMSVTMQ